ncbi:MAG: cytochrome c [Rhizobiaceae bacterium]
MKKLFLALTLSAVAATVTFAGPLEDREVIMKSFGKAVGSVAPIAKGEAPFDAAVVAAAFATINENAAKIDVAALFPAGSNTGESTASPKIWEDLAGFTAGMDKFKADAAAAAAANPADLAAFQAEFGKLTKNCGTCHETFRIKKG